MNSLSKGKSVWIEYDYLTEFPGVVIPEITWHQVLRFFNPTHSLSYYHTCIGSFPGSTVH